MNPCPACHRGALSPLFRSYSFDSGKEPFDLLQCEKCEVVSTSLFLRGEDLAKYYHSDYYGGDVGLTHQLKSQKKFNPLVEAIVRLSNRVRARELTSRLPPCTQGGRAKILDVGCGRANFLRTLAEQGYECVGTDISQFEGIETRNLRFLRGQLEDLALESESFDGVSIWHVLEHVQDPVLTLREIHRVLKPNGILALAVPNFGSWQAKLFGKHWFHLDLPRHLFHFRLESLSPILENWENWENAENVENVENVEGRKLGGFQILSIRTLSWDQNLYGWIQSFQNVLFHQHKPNELFSFLKNRKPASDSSSVFSWNRVKGFMLLGLGGILMIPAWLDTCVSAFFNRGATLIIYARKCEQTVHEATHGQF